MEMTKWYTWFMVGVALLALAPAALASSLTFEVNVNFGMSPSSPYYPYYTSSNNGASVTGQAKFPLEGPVNQSGTYSGGPWLTNMTAEFGPFTMRGYLAGQGPQPQGGLPGHIEEAAEVRMVLSYYQNYQISWDKSGSYPFPPLGDMIGVVINYSFSATLDQSGGNPFNNGVWQAKLTTPSFPYLSEWVFSEPFPAASQSFAGTGSTTIDWWAWWHPDDWYAGPDANNNGYPDYLYGNWSGETELILTMSQKGDTVVPLPGAVWLFGSGLLGLVGWRRFRKS